MNSPSIRQYKFEVEGSPCHLSFWVAASSRETAVTKANESLADFESGSDFYIGLNSFGGYATLNLDLKVTADNIADDRPAPAFPERALQLLKDHEYENSGFNLNHWRDLLFEDNETQWTRGFAVGGGHTGGIYGFMQVLAKLGMDGATWCFYIRAFVYPGKHADGLTGESGGIRYTVELQDGQIFLDEDRLIDALPVYEKKFSELIYALRETDPVDGLALTDAERLTGFIEGFMPRHRFF